MIFWDFDNFNRLSNKSAVLGDIDTGLIHSFINEFSKNKCFGIEGARGRNFEGENCFQG